MKSIDVTKDPPDNELICKCGKRILFWHALNRVAHEKPECSWFGIICEGLKGHQREGEVLVIEPEENEP